jgi:hypothetical protein
VLLLLMLVVLLPLPRGHRRSSREKRRRVARLRFVRVARHLIFIYS